MDVKRTDRLGKRLKLAGTQATVNVDARTKVRRGGKAGLGDLQANDRVVVLARACKPAAGSDAAPALLARVVVARPAATDSKSTPKPDSQPSVRYTGGQRSGFRGR